MLVKKNHQETFIICCSKNNQSICSKVSSKVSVEEVDGTRNCLLFFGRGGGGGGPRKNGLNWGLIGKAGVGGVGGVPGGTGEPPTEGGDWPGVTGELPPSGVYVISS